MKHLLIDCIMKIKGKFSSGVRVKFIYTRFSNEKTRSYPMLLDVEFIKLGTWFCSGILQVSIIVTKCVMEG